MGVRVNRKQLWIHDPNLWRGRQIWNFWAVALEKLCKTNEARNLSLFIFCILFLSRLLFHFLYNCFLNFSTFACLVCVTNLSGTWCGSHLAWLHFNSRRVQRGNGNGNGNGNGETETDIRVQLFVVYMVYGIWYSVWRVIIYYFCFWFDCVLCTSSTPALNVLYIMSVCCCCCCLFFLFLIFLLLLLATRTRFLVSPGLSSTLCILCSTEPSVSHANAILKEFRAWPAR